MLPQLGVKIHCTNGEPIHQLGGKSVRSEVRLVQSIVIPGHHGKFVETKCEVSFQEGDEILA